MFARPTKKLKFHTFLIKLFKLNKEIKYKKYSAILPIIGSILFIILYIVAAINYPGGSQFDVHSKGFSLMHNYWCNLLNEKAINGQQNTARIIAFIALGILSVSIMFFLSLVPTISGSKKSYKIIYFLSGFLSMIITPFVFTAHHDLITNLSALFGCISLSGTFTGLYKLGWKRFFSSGLFIIAMIIINSILYYENGLYYLPLVQKITFVYVLSWICSLSFRVFKY